MQGFIHRRIPIWVRRIVTVLPTLVIIWVGLDPTRTLVISQVVLSFALPFALVPLLQFTMNRALMGPLVNRRTTSLAAGLVVALIIALNLFLLQQLFFAKG